MTATVIWWCSKTEKGKYIHKHTSSDFLEDQEVIEWRENLHMYLVSEYTVVAILQYWYYPMVLLFVMGGGLMHHFRLLCILAYSDVHVSLCSVFRVVLFAMISAYKPCSVRVNLQFFVGQRMSHLRDVCLIAYSGVQQILVLFLICFSTSCVSYVANIPGLSFLIAPSVFSIVFLIA
jgi:hypothetical protein